MVIINPPRGVRRVRSRVFSNFSADPRSASLVGKLLSAVSTRDEEKEKGRRLRVFVHCILRGFPLSCKPPFDAASLSCANGRLSPFTRRDHAPPQVNTIALSRPEDVPSIPCSIFPISFQSLTTQTPPPQHSHPLLLLRPPHHSDAVSIFSHFSQ